MILGLATSPRIKEIKKLSESFSLPPIINCIVFDSEREAEHWIELKHTGQHGGAGMVPWGSVETLRFTHRDKEKPIELQLLDFAASYLPIINIHTVRITNLERIVSDPFIRESLGIFPIDGMVHVDRQLTDFAKIFGMLLSEMTAEGFTVNVIKTKTDRRLFITRFLEKHEASFSNFTRDAGNRYPISGKSAIIVEPSLKKSVKTVLRISLHKSVFSEASTNECYSQHTRALAKELKDFGFEKGPIGAIYLMQAFLERFIVEGNKNNSGDKSSGGLKSQIKIFIENIDTCEYSIVHQAANLLISSPLVSKRMFDGMLTMPRHERIEYMNTILEAIGILVAHLNRQVRKPQK